MNHRLKGEDTEYREAFGCYPGATGSTWEIEVADIAVANSDVNYLWRQYPALRGQSMFLFYGRPLN